MNKPEWIEINALNETDRGAGGFVITGKINYQNYELLFNGWTGNSRLEPYFNSTTKPLVPVAGKPIVQRLVEDIASVLQLKSIEEIRFIGRFWS